jgi:hypothetical protein
MHPPPGATNSATSTPPAGVDDGHGAGTAGTVESDGTTDRNTCVGSAEAAVPDGPVAPADAQAANRPTRRIRGVARTFTGIRV